MAPYPVQLEVSAPAQFDRIQLLIRLALSAFFGWLGITMGWVTSALFFALPVFAAIMLSTRGPDYYLHTTTSKVWPVARWLLAFFAYMLLLTDRMPVDDRDDVRVELRPTGHPTVGSALLRLLMSIPSAFVLCFVGIAACILWLVAALSILFTRTVPPSILAFQTGYLRWHARLLAYHASFVDDYPPFSFHDRPTTTPASMVAP